MLGDSEILALVCGLEGGSELQMSGFEFVNLTNYGLKDERYTTALLSYCSYKVIAMMKNMRYMPSMGLGKKGRGVAEFPYFKTQLTKEGLRFFEAYNGIKKNLGTQNVNFVKEGRDFLFCGFLKLWVDKEGKVNLGWEIFFNERLTFKEKPTVVIKEIQEEVYWMDYMDAEAIKTMLKGERDMLANTIEELSDPSTFIVPMVGQLDNWTWVEFYKNMGKEFCSASSDVLLNVFKKMNFDLTYFDMSYNIEILHLK